MTGNMYVISDIGLSPCVAQAAVRERLRGQALAPRQQDCRSSRSADIPREDGKPRQRINGDYKRVIRVSPGQNLFPVTTRNDTNHPVR